MSVGSSEPLRFIGKDLSLSARLVLCERATKLMEALTDQMVSAFLLAGEVNEVETMVKDALVLVEADHSPKNLGKAGSILLMATVVQLYIHKEF